MNVLLLIDFSASISPEDLIKFKGVYKYFHETLKIENLMTYGFDEDIFRINEKSFEILINSIGTNLQKIHSMFSEKYFDWCVVCSDGFCEVPFGKFKKNVLYIPDGSRNKADLEDFAWEVNFI